MNYEWIKQAASARRQPVSSLLALARANDPFFAGCPAQQRDAEWFRQVWEQFGFGDGIHVRRIHYRLAVCPEPVVRPNGVPFQNTHECWNYLGQASKAARYLRLVDPALFIDRRNPEPQIFATSREYRLHPAWELTNPEWNLPSILIDFDCFFTIPTPMVSGYEYQLADQRYHLILMIEKSTMNDLLEPICRTYGMDLVTGIGFQSISTVITLLRQRVQVYGKPVRILYISDFDPAGEQMPVATARQFEYWRTEYAPDAEIKLLPLALTRQQVIHYALPRIPIKESDLRKRGFEDRHGEGAVELDALEALYPGELRRIVLEAIAPYFDSDLRRHLANAETEAEEDAQAQWHEVIGEEAAELADIRRDADHISGQFRKPAENLQRDFQAAMKPVRDRLDAVQHAIQAKAQAFKLMLPERPEASPADVSEDHWLFDSGRSYFDQLAEYRRRKAGSNGNGDED